MPHQRQGGAQARLEIHPRAHLGIPAGPCEFAQVTHQGGSPLQTLTHDLGEFHQVIGQVPRLLGTGFSLVGLQTTHQSLRIRRVHVRDGLGEIAQVLDRGLHGTNRIQSEIDRVVHLVGKASGQFTHRGQALGSHQLHLGLLEFAQRPFQGLVAIGQFALKARDPHQRPDPR